MVHQEAPPILKGTTSKHTNKKMALDHIRQNANFTKIHQQDMTYNFMSAKLTDIKMKLLV